MKRATREGFAKKKRAEKIFWLSGKGSKPSELDCLEMGLISLSSGSVSVKCGKCVCVSYFLMNVDIVYVNKAYM